MKQKTCVIIGVVISVLTILAFLRVPILGTDFMGSIGVPDTDFKGGWGFATGAYIGNVILMVVSCILIYNNSVKTVNILYPIAVVLSFISLFVSFSEIDSDYILGQWDDQTAIFIDVLLVMALVQVVTLIRYYYSTPRRKIMNIIPLKKVPGGLLLAWGLGTYFVLGLVATLTSYMFKTFSDIVLTFSFVALVVYIVGIWRTFFYRPDRKIKGTALVITGFSIIAVVQLLGCFTLNFNDIANGNISDESLIYLGLLGVCRFFLSCIAGIVCAIGFIRIGRTGQYGYMGKHGVGFLKAAAWINIGYLLVFLIFPLFIITFILQWKGWRYLLSSWYGENDPELPNVTENISENNVIVKE